MEDITGSGQYSCSGRSLVQGRVVKGCIGSVVATWLHMQHWEGLHVELFLHVCVCVCVFVCLCVCVFVCVCCVHVVLMVSVCYCNTSLTG